jgi:predicted DsbA family dithiol-disulfide isomerase
MNDPPRAEIAVRVDYDFASSLCYVAHRCMQRLAGEIDALGIRLVWSPLDLTPLTGWRRGAEVDEDRRRNVQRVSAELGVPLRMPAVWLDSRRAHATALGLDATREPTWREAVFSMIFEAGRWPTDENLEALAREIGLPLEEEALERGGRELLERTRRAHEQEVTGVPNFMLGEWPFGGIQSDDTMLSIFGRFATRCREARP